MTYADYLAVDGTRSDAGLPAMADRQRTVEEFVAGMQRLGVDADSARAVLRRPMGAVRDAPPAPGRFPLVVHLPGFEGRPMDQCVMFEYLASHGYVVAACPSLPVMPGDWGKGFAGVEAQIRDLEFVRSDVGALPWVDAAHWAASGFSYGGLGCVLAALQRGDASAVISLDGNIVRRGIRKLLETDERYRPGKLQSPFLLLVRGDNREQEFSFFDKAVNADRWRLRLRALEHADFMSAGLIQESAFPPDPAFETRLRGHEAACRCIRRFLDAILRSDAAARAVLGAGPSALGIAPGQAELTIKRRKTQRQ